jgi:hypothetical protein
MRFSRVYSWRAARYTPLSVILQDAMRAEHEALVESIKQSVGLLRRHL